MKTQRLKTKLSHELKKMKTLKKQWINHTKNKNNYNTNPKHFKHNRLDTLNIQLT